jgi:SAM-dependent methyltransferase
LVDLGSGAGIFCEAARERLSVEVLGVDPTAEGSDGTVRSAAEDLEGLSANVITLFELIEHVHSPADLLGACHRILVPDGLLLVSTVNVKGFDLAVLGPISDNVVAPIHINYFTPGSLERLLGDNGFDILELTTPGSLDVFNVVEKRRQVQLGGFLDDLVDNHADEFQAFLADNLLSSHMVVIARKRG